MEAKTKLVRSEFRVKNMRHGGDSLRLVSCLLPRQIRSIPSLLPIPSSRQMTGTRYGVSRSGRPVTGFAGDDLEGGRAIEKSANLSFVEKEHFFLIQGIFPRCSNFVKRRCGNFKDFLTRQFLAWQRTIGCSAATTVDFGQFPISTSAHILVTLNYLIKVHF